MHHTYALHKIDNATNFTFSATDYSLFKFGDEAVAENFGTTLAKGFIQDVLEKNRIQNQIVIISSPYAFIPTATFALKNYFVFTLNAYLAKNNLAVVQETKIYRTVTYKEDYGELDAAQRMQLIGNDRFEIDAKFVENKTLIFLDDIRITGSHERMIQKMLTNYNLNNTCHLLYFAQLVNLDIHPNIENYLNYYAVKNIFDIETIYKTSRFAINTRLVKYILNSSVAHFSTFLNNNERNFLYLIYNNAIGNSYHTIGAYSVNLNLLEKYLEKYSKLEFKQKNI